MGKLEDLKVELTAARDKLLPQIEGLHDFSRLNLQPETLIIVQGAIVDFERRRDLINTTLSSLDNLASDTYPDLAQRSVIAAVYADLRDNVTTIEAAFSKFVPIGEATHAVITASEPRLKPGA